MALRLYNTLSKQKELFEPVEPGKVRIYLCGPTVYKESHIGHAVGPVIFDALKKYLSYKGYEVTLVINITDVDDKLIIEAQQRGVAIDELAAEVSAGYFDAMEKLGVNSVNRYPRATDHIAQIIELIRRLEGRQAAYAVDGDVYFDVSRYADYGKLSHRRSEDQVEGTRQLDGQGKRHAADFALWKKAGADEIGWDSPWGRGRPGWHIECSAMSIEHLGETYDIHGGGMDLIFPHHENEIAQSEMATGKPYVKYWLHNGLTRLRTKAAGGEWKAEKMSKSLGNIRTLRELFAVYPPAGLRFFLLSTHYRRPIDFSEEAIDAVLKGLRTLHRTIDRVARLSGADVYGTGVDIARLAETAESLGATAFGTTVSEAQLHYLEALDDDFNTAGAIAVLFELAGAVNRFIDEHKLETKGNPGGRVVALEAARLLTDLGQIVGLLTGPLAEQPAQDELAEKLMALFIELRAGARQDRNFALADGIRDGLKAIGVVLEDRPDGTIWHKE